MAINPPSSANLFDESLRDVFSFREAIPMLNEYLSTIQIDDENSGILFDWDLDNLNAFVTAINTQDPTRAPKWLRTPPPNVTPNSFTDDAIHELQQVAGGHCGRVLLAPNTLSQFSGVVVTLVSFQNDVFLQGVGQIALPVVDHVDHQHLATTYYLLETRAEKSEPNNFPPTLRNGEPLRRLFI